MLPFPIISNTNIPLRPILNGLGTADLQTSVIPFTYGLRSVIIGDLMYYIPGYNNSSYTSAGGFYTYNMVTGIISTLSSPPDVLTLPFISVLGGDIYIGSGRITTATTGTLNTTVYKYVISTDTWSAVGTSINIGYTAGTTIGTKIYTARPNFVDIYDSTLGSTTSISCPFNSAGVSAYTSYSYITSNAVDTLYVCGTINPTTRPVNYLYSYNINTGVWTNLNLPTEVGRVGALVYNPDDGFMYMYGANSIYAYNSGYGVIIPRTGVNPSRRDYTSFVYYNSSLYMFSVNETTYKGVRYT